MENVPYFELDWRETFAEQRKCRIAPVTAGSLLTLSPGVAIGGGIIIAVGAAAILAAHLERRLAERGDERARDMATWTIAALMAIGLIGFAWLILKNPLWELFG